MARCTERLNRDDLWLAMAMAFVVAVGLLIGCGSGGEVTAPPGPICDAPDCGVDGGPRPDPIQTPAPCAGEDFAGTFDAIQKVVFERRGCTNDLCHGTTRSGGLDLRREAAYANLFEAPSPISRFLRVQPGASDRSFLFIKLAAAADPTIGPIDGSPMPLAQAPLTEEELELIRRWIVAGAPETGTVRDTEQLVDGCLPPVDPIHIDPLDPPPAGEGLQLEMPEWKLDASSQHEVCFATYFDVSDQVAPGSFGPGGNGLFRFKSIELRQDPQSHHLVLYLVLMPRERLTDPSFGAWTCKGGEHSGEACDPLAPPTCGGGHCASTPQDGFACLGYGPPGAFSLGSTAFQIGGAQQAQSYVDFYDGVFAQIPTRGVLFWNSHAFNATTKDHIMRGRLNYWFAKPEEQIQEVRTINNTERVFSANTAPYTSEEICHTHLLPQHAQLFELTSHTHKRGKRFTVFLPSGEQIYESLRYDDPRYERYDPPLSFDSPEAADRTLRFCSLYNNGERPDGTPDPETVTRLSRMPDSVRVPGVPGLCRPVACVTGKIGAACGGEGDDATCDSAPGAGDGWCDACRITGGESTENEMFMLIGQYFVAHAAGHDGSHPAGTPGLD